jgi:hypothetical protein
MACETFAPGAPTTWLHRPRGGYGYVYPVDGIVVRQAAQRVVIRVPLKDGTPVERRVRPEHLRRREVTPQPEYAF